MYRKPHLTPCLIVFLGLLLLSTSGCATRQSVEPKTARYTLDYDPPVFTGLPRLDTTLRVAPFGSAPEYDTERILYKTGKFTLDSYNYHAWLAKPAAQVRFFLGRDLQASGLFTGVLAESSRSRPAYLLDGSVEKFLEVDDDKGWFAELGLSVTLQRLPHLGGLSKVLEQRQYQTRVACPRKDPRAVAEAMSHAMAELSKRIQQDIYNSLKTDLADQTGG